MRNGKGVQYNLLSFPYKALGHLGENQTRAMVTFGALNALTVSHLDNLDGHRTRSLLDTFGVEYPIYLNLEFDFVYDYENTYI